MPTNYTKAVSTQYRAATTVTIVVTCSTASLDSFLLLDMSTEVNGVEATQNFPAIVDSTGGACGPV